MELPVRPASPPIPLSGYASPLPTSRRSLHVRPEWWTGPTRSTCVSRPGRHFSCRRDSTISTVTLRLPRADDQHALPARLPERHRRSRSRRVCSTRIAWTTRSRPASRDLIGMQTADGGLAMWPGGREPWPWASVYAAHFLVEAKAAGYEVPESSAITCCGYVRIAASD